MYSRQFAPVYTFPRDYQLYFKVKRFTSTYEGGINTVTCFRSRLENYLRVYYTQ